MKRRGRGRPPLPAKDRVSALISVRITKDELVEVKKRAKASRVSVSSLIRRVLFGGTK